MAFHCSIFCCSSLNNSAHHRIMQPTRIMGDRKQVNNSDPRKEKGDRLRFRSVLAFSTPATCVNYSHQNVVLQEKHSIARFQEDVDNEATYKSTLPNIQTDQRMPLERCKNPIVDKTYCFVLYCQKRCGWRICHKKKARPLCRGLRASLTTRETR